jgi:hypothetical protein
MVSGVVRNKGAEVEKEEEEEVEKEEEEEEEEEDKVSPNMLNACYRE